MSKSNYKVLQQQFKQKHGFALEGLPVVKKQLNAAVEAATAEVDELLTVLHEPSGYMKSSARASTRTFPVCVRSHPGGKLRTRVIP